MDQIKDFFTFNRLLTPTLIKYLYWISSAGVILAGVSGIVLSIINLISNFSFASILLFFLSPVFMIISLLWVRVMCEKILVSFLIEARLRELNHRIGGGR